ncbi:MAG: hypothetical protein ACK4VO_03980 [Pseudobdellovibrio sp.]
MMYLRLTALLLFFSKNLLAQTPLITCKFQYLSPDQKIIIAKYEIIQNRPLQKMQALISTQMDSNPFETTSAETVDYAEYTIRTNMDPKKQNLNEGEGLILGTSEILKSINKPESATLQESFKKMYKLKVYRTGELFGEHMLAIVESFDSKNNRINKFITGLIEPQICE